MNLSLRIFVNPGPEVPYTSYIVHFLSEINEAEVAGLQQIY